MDCIHNYAKKKSLATKGHYNNVSVHLQDRRNFDIDIPIKITPSEVWKTKSYITIQPKFSQMRGRELLQKKIKTLTREEIKTTQKTQRIYTTYYQETWVTVIIIWDASLIYEQIPLNQRQNNNQVKLLHFKLGSTNVKINPNWLVWDLSASTYWQQNPLNIAILMWAF